MNEKFPCLSLPHFIYPLPSPYLFDNLCKILVKISVVIDKANNWNESKRRAKVKMEWL